MIKYNEKMNAVKRKKHKTEKVTFLQIAVTPKYSENNYEVLNQGLYKKVKWVYLPKIKCESLPASSQLFSEGTAEVLLRLSQVR